VHGPDADPIVYRCRVHDGKQSGVLLYQGGRGVFEECDFFGHTLSAVEVREASDPIVRKCRISGGVSVTGQSRGTFEDCNIFGNTLSGVEVKEAATRQSAGARSMAERPAA
jgi:hypothetical protein